MMVMLMEEKEGDEVCHDDDNDNKMTVIMVMTNDNTSMSVLS